MPVFIKQSNISLLTIVLLSLLMGLIPAIACSHEGIELFYIRYDVKTSKHKIVDTNLIMIPSQDEFRAEKFSTIQTYGAISATYNESEKKLTKFAREKAIISLLRKYGLRSIKSRDYDTIVSYEGAIKAPIIILEKGLVEKNNSYFVKIQADFSPIAFPDKWKNLKIKNRIKKMFSNFISLFK